MRKSLTLATACLCGAFAAPAFAQAPKTPSSPPNFISSQAPSQWRASKMAGVDVYGADNKKIGSIDDILINSQGQAKVAVIGIGGFLGVGQKNVGVPFDSLKFSNQVEGRTAASNSSNGSASSNGPAEYPARAELDATKQQLQNAPDFKYASNETKTTSSRPARTSPNPTTSAPPAH